LSPLSALRTRHPCSPPPLTPLITSWYPSPLPILGAKTPVTPLKPFLRKNMGIPSFTTIERAAVPGYLEFRASTRLAPFAPFLSGRRVTDHTSPMHGKFFPLLHSHFGQVSIPQQLPVSLRRNTRGGGTPSFPPSFLSASTLFSASHKYLARRSAVSPSCAERDGARRKISDASR
jgi:hypothetical protein